jgi:hypothetical protein
MTEWHTLREWNTARFRVTLDWTWEDFPDLSWDETGETTEKVQSGEWGVYTFRARVTLDGREIACDYLGNSIYADPAEFIAGHREVGKARRETGQNYGCYFSDMIRTVASEARDALKDAPRVRRVAA